MLEGLDFASPTWTALKKWANAEIATCHLGLETSGTDSETTAHLRGRIRQCRALIAHGKIEPEIRQQPSDF